MGETRKALNILVRKLHGRRPLEKCGNKLDYNTEMYFTETDCEYMKRTKLNRVQWQGFLDQVSTYL